MPKPSDSASILDSARISPEIFELRPDYRALLMIVSGIPPSSSDSLSESLLQEAEASAKEALTKQAVTDVPHVAAWREAYKAFGAKPAKFRNSLEALTRRVQTGLPRVNRLTDIYNAISVKRQIPLGGEDLDKYVGPPKLIRATGTEKFDTSAGGEAVTELADSGEVVWCDDAGVTCRRWNWRQGTRTALTEETTRVLFIMDALDVMSDDALVATADELGQVLKNLSPNIEVMYRILSKPNA